VSDLATIEDGTMRTHEQRWRRVHTYYTSIGTPRGVWTYISPGGRRYMAMEELCEYRVFERIADGGGRGLPRWYQSLSEARADIESRELARAGAR
jgi:hypothetical protein